MNELRTEAIKYVRSHTDQFIEELKEFIKIPSISTYPQHDDDVRSAADWIASQLRSIGLKNVKVISTSRHPIVYGELITSKPSVPTVLIYGHYDVQPPEPLDQWNSAPFEPTVRGDNLFGRGASDMKGQIFACLKGIEAILQKGTFPINIKYLIEGEEEIGSPSINNFLDENRSLLSSDVVFNPDAGMISADKPAITYGLRGVGSYELQVYGPEHDLHSGLYGGIIHNPAQVLCELIAGMHNERGQITLPRFYDHVVPIRDKERAKLAQHPMSEQQYLSQTGAPALWGEEGYTLVERIVARPTLEINGILSGFTGSGSKTIIPYVAMAKITMRLVPDQDPDEVHQQLTDYLSAKAPKTVRWNLIRMSDCPACITDINIPAEKALYRALETVWGNPPVYKREGGTIPVVASVKKILGIDSVLSGFGLPDDNIHAPNEKLHLPTWKRGIEALVHFFFNMAQF